MGQLMGEATGPRPSRRPWHAFTWLDHFAIVSYAVDPARVDAALPAGVEAERFAVDGTTTAVVSAVSANDRRFRFRGLPRPTLSGGQIDYRTYVRAGAETGVWFFGASLDSALAAVARIVWSMPWHHEEIALDATWRDDTLDRMCLRARGAWGDATLDLRGPGPDDGPDPLAAIAMITDPTVGWYPRGGRIGRYGVWHPPLALEPARVVAARHQVFEQLDLIDTDQAPVSALVQRAVALDVQTPPRRWRPPDAGTVEEGQGSVEVAT